MQYVVSRLLGRAVYDCLVVVDEPLSVAITNVFNVSYVVIFLIVTTITLLPVLLLFKLCVLVTKQI